MSLALLGEAACGVLGACAGVAVIGTANHYTYDRSLTPVLACSHCGRHSPASAYLPILGPIFAFRCPACRKSGPWWLAAMVQAAMAVIWGLLAARYGPGWPLLSSLLLTAILGAIAVIDFQHRLIPSYLVYPAGLLALVGSPAWPGLGLLSSLEGGAVGFALFYALALLARFAFGEGALGDGDVTLAAAIGAICGFPLVVLALAVGAFLGGMGAILVLIARRSPLGTAIPYGPYLIGGVIYVLLAGNTLHPMYTVL